MFNISCFYPPQSFGVQVRLRWSRTESILGSWSPLPHLPPCAVSPPESIQTVAWGPAWTPHWGSGPPLGDQRPAENNGEPHLAGRASLSPGCTATPAHTVNHTQVMDLLKGLLPAGTYFSGAFTHIYTKISLNHTVRWVSNVKVHPHSISCTFFWGQMKCRFLWSYASHW